MDIYRNKEFEKLLEENGIKYKVMSVSHLEFIEDDINAKYKKGIIDEKIYDYYLKYFNYEYKNKDNQLKIIITAKSQKISVVVFKYKKRDLKAIIPPTYIYTKDRELCFNILRQSFSYVEKARLPLKLLSAYSGLSVYGKNNITYIPEMGSFVRLDAFLVRYEGERDDWNKFEIMDECNYCDRCIKNCPRHCISEHNFIIDAGKCITLYSEIEGSFKDNGIPVSVINALIGCMRCQIACPVNQPFLKSREVVELFNEEETQMILDDTFRNNQDLMTKLKTIDLNENEQVISRNLRALMIKNKIL
jgi:epoxyqueuosine reductase